jgi:hypothetical protein
MTPWRMSSSDRPFARERALARPLRLRFLSARRI